MASGKPIKFQKDLQYYKFCSYGFLKNLRLYEPFLILFFLENNLSFLQIGVLYSVREISRNILEIPAGIIADAIGRKKTMISSFSFYIVAFIIFFFSQHYIYFIAAMLVYSFGDAFRTGTHKAMIFDYLSYKGWKDQKVHYYGHTRSFSQFGSAISSIIAGLLVFYTGSFRLIFIFTIIPYLLDLVLISTYPKILNGQVSSVHNKQIGKAFKNVINDFIFSFKSGKLFKAITNLSIYTGYYKALKDYLQPVIKTWAIALPVMMYLNDKQKAAVMIGIIYFIIYLLSSFASRNSGNFSQRFSKINIPLNLTLYLGLLAGLISGIFFNLNFIFLSILFYILIYIVENLRKPIGVSLVAEASPKKDILATLLSAESQAHSLIAAILAPMIGFLADKMGIGYAMIIVSGLLILISPLVLIKSNIRKGKL